MSADEHGYASTCGDMSSPQTRTGKPAEVIKLEQDYLGAIEVAKNTFVTWVGTIDIFAARRILDNVTHNNKLAFMQQQQQQ